MFEKSSIEVYFSMISRIRFFQILFILLLLFILYYMLNRKVHIENFIGKAKIPIINDDTNNDNSDDPYEISDEKKGETKSYDTFPPLENKSKYDLLNDVFGKHQPGSDSNNDSDNDDDLEEKSDDNEKKNSGSLPGIKDIPIKTPGIKKAGVMEPEKSTLQKRVSKLDDSKPLMGTCNFYSNKCPANMNMMGSLSGTNLKCGNQQQNSVQAMAIAEIQSGHLSKIILVNGGSGYNQENPPKVNIEGGRGNGASATAEVSSEGVVTSIDIVDYGYGYVETPKIVIEAPQMESVCYLCC